MTPAGSYVIYIHPVGGFRKKEITKVLANVVLWWLEGRLA